jgi:hypothetical protein
MSNLQVRVAAIALLFLPPLCYSLVPHLEQPYKDPPATISAEDLTGIWVARYPSGTDELQLTEDGTFRQCYRHSDTSQCSFDTPWTQFSIEPLPDGRVYIHLPGARYFLAGERIAELDGQEDPCPLPDCPIPSGQPRTFFDPVGHDTVEMPGELLLNIRATSHGELALLHMWTSSDRGFAIIGGDHEEFRKAAP